MSGEAASPAVAAPAEVQRLQQPADHLVAQAPPGSGGGGGGSPQASSPAPEVGEAKPVAAAAAVEAGAEPDSGGQRANGGPAGGGGKRDYVRWAPEEEQVFYSALRGVAGQKPEVCLKEITVQLAGSKDYAQVRHYYYRLIKRLNRIMGAGSALDTKNPLQVHRSMIKFWEVVVDKGMRGTCMVGIMKKPRKQRELSNTVQRGVAAVVKRTTGGGATGKAAGGGARSGSSSRKRKPRAADADGAAAAAGIGQVDVEMADAMAPPPAKQQRRTAGPSTRQQQLLAAAEAEAAVGSGIGDTAAVAEGSSQSQTDGHEGNIPSQQPATSSHSAGSHPQDLAQPPRASTAYSFRSSSNAGLSGAVLEGSMGQVGGKLRLQLVPLDPSTAQAMSAVGYHPFLELTLSTSKSLLSVLRHLGIKWQAAAPDACGNEPAVLFVHPPADGPIPLRGICWGGPDCDSQLKMGDIYTTLHCPAPFQLLYSWGRPAGSAAPVAAAAAPLPVPPGKQTSSRAAQRSAEAAQLTAELREAISAVAAATGPAGAAAPVSGHSQQKQEQQRAAAPGLFLQLLQGSEAENHAMPAAEAAVELSFGGFLDGAEAPQFCTQQQSAAPPSLAVGGGGTPVQAAQPCSSEAHMVADEAAATPGTGDPRKPRGLLSLLQTSAGKAGKRTPAIRKQGAQSQRKASCTSSIGANQRSRGRRQKQQQQQQQPTSLLQQQQGAGEAPYGMPLPAGFAPYPWTHMHPHLQAVPILQQPQLIQPVLQVPVLQPQHPGHEPAHLPSQPAKQPQAAAGSHRLPPELDFGGDSLFQLLDPGHASPATGLPNLSLFGSPEKGECQQPSSAAPILESGDFSLKSWPTLSPPSNFQFPDGFDPGLSPMRKRGTAGAHLPPAGTLTGGTKDGTAAAASGPAGAMGSVLGPTDFSLLMADVSAGAVATAATQQQTAMDAGTQQQLQQQQCCAQPAAPQQHQGQQQQALRTTAAAQQAADALLGSSSLHGLLGTTTRSPEDGAAATGAALPLLPDKELADLTFDFGSLLGVGDAAPSWLGPSGRPAQQPDPAQHPDQQAIGDRPFASLFDN